MNAGVFFIKTALTHLRRGGQRNLVAFLCVAFGVMSLVAMTTMASSIEKMLVLKPYELIGGDLTLGREGEETISVEEENQLKQMLAAGEISNYTMMDYSTSLSFHLPDSGELFFPSYGMGVDTDKYPLAGNLTISDPLNGVLENLIKSPGDVIVTSDLALTYHLKTGDTIVLSDLDYGKALTATIRGIASDTPNHQGSKIYYAHETAHNLTGLDRTANTVLVNTENANGVAEILKANGWWVYIATDLAAITAASAGTLAMILNDIGLLGLLVSGIAIANTMQVLLHRRRKEVAVWKTIGYTSKQIQAMFVIEAAILGFGGSLVGTGLGVLLSYGLVGLFSRITTVLVKLSFSPVEAAAGLVIGTVTTIIFAMWAIVSTSCIRPLALIRNEDLELSKIPMVQGILLGLSLIIPFIAIAVWVLKSFLIGLLVLFGSMLILTGIGFGLWLLVKLVIKLLPNTHWAVGQLSRQNLRRRGSSQIFAMVALFVGTMMLGFGALLTESGQQLVGSLGQENGSENLAIYASPADDAVIKQILATNNFNAYSSGHVYRVEEILAPGIADYPLTPTLMGRSDPGSAIIHGAEWGSQPEGLYAYPYSGFSIGSSIEITDISGEIHSLKVVGTFENGDQAAWPGMNNQLLVAEELGQKLGQMTNSQFFLTIKPAQLDSTIRKLGKVLPQATMISMPDFQGRFIRQYQNLFAFVAVMAGLAILAGILLVANSVSLAMLDRRFEIGVLKSIGYSRGQVLFSQVVEYTLMSVVVTLTALGSIWALTLLTNLLNNTLGSMLIFKPETAGMIALVTIGFTALSVLWATWKPSSVSPVFVLNDRE